MENHLISDHVPIELVINVNVVHGDYTHRFNVQKHAWGRADEQMSQYKSNLDKMLNGIKCDKDVLGCANVFCNEHLDKVNVLYISGYNISMYFVL